MVSGFTNWSLRVKVTALLVVVALLPTAIAGYVDFRKAEAQQLANMRNLLQARSDQLVRELDNFNQAYRRAASRITLFPDVANHCAVIAHNKTPSAASAADVGGIFDTYPISDEGIRGVGLLDRYGRVVLASEAAMVGADLSFQPHIHAALQGATVISDVFLGIPAVGEIPTIAYTAPILGADGRPACVIALWIHASTLWRVFKTSNALAGANSFAVLFDQHGIRIAHTYSDDMAFHPAGTLDAVTRDELIAQRRFGSRTQGLLDDVRVFPEQFERARAPVPDFSVFRGFAPANQAWNFGVARRSSTVPWTVFYMVPEAEFIAQVAAFTQEKILLTSVVIAFAGLAGLLLGHRIVQPIQALSAATVALAGGKLETRVRHSGADEFGRLGASFNTMADQIEAQATQLQRSRDELDRRVQERTAELRQTASNLANEVAVREHTERAIRESQLLLQSIVDNTTAVIYVKDLEGRYLLVNRRFAEIFHVAPEAIIGRTDHDFFSKEAADLFRAVDVRAAAAEESLVEEETVPQDDGLHTFVSVKCPLRDATGNVTGIFGISTDITDRKLAEAKLQAHLERLSLLDQITHAIGERQDLQSIYQVAIRSLEERLPVDFSCICRYDSVDNQLTVIRVGVATEALAIELALTENANVPVDQNGLSRCVQGELVYEPDINSVEFPFPQRLARGGLGSLVVAPLQSENRVFGVLVAARRRPEAFSSSECEFLHQLSAHVALAAQQAQLHAALQQAYDDLRQSQQTVMQQERLRALGQMASGIAHDINNAISPAALYSESLLETETGLSNRGRNYLQTIARAINDVAATVARMREFYRQREPQLTMLPIKLNNLAAQILELTRARWSDMSQQRGAFVRLETDFAPALPEVLGIESEVREALINLVFNAVDAMPQGGVLTLRTRYEPAENISETLGHASVEVIDSGVGMDEDTRRRCLEPFFTTKGERGTGLGLAMVYGVAQRHGADIEIDSQLGRGTRVRLRFVAPVTTPASAPLVSISEPLSRLRILVIDDDPLLLQSLRDILESDGHEVVTAAGGLTGINAFRAAQLLPEGRFHVVITDLGMPYIDGRKVAASIKEIAAETPVILLTGWGQRLRGDNERPANVDFVLSKPPKLGEVREVLMRSQQKSSGESTAEGRP